MPIRQCLKQHIILNHCGHRAACVPGKHLLFAVQLRYALTSMIPCVSSAPLSLRRPCPNYVGREHSEGLAVGVANPGAGGPGVHAAGRGGAAGRARRLRRWLRQTALGTAVIDGRGESKPCWPAWCIRCVFAPELRHCGKRSSSKPRRNVCASLMTGWNRDGDPDRLANPGLAAAKVRSTVCFTMDAPSCSRSDHAFMPFL